VTLLLFAASAFSFNPNKIGLHETYMNQSNPENSAFAKSNDIFQDGAVII
jgi:uncharacterized protein YukJ